MPGSTPTHLPPTLSSTTSPTCRERSIASASFQKAKILTASAQLGEIGGKGAEFAREFHAHRYHQIGRQQPRQPQLSLIGRVGAAAVGGKAGNPVPPHSAHTSRTADVRQDLRRGVGEAEIVAAPAVEDRECQRTGA